MLVRCVRFGQSARAWPTLYSYSVASQTSFSSQHESFPPSLPSPTSPSSLPPSFPHYLRPSLPHAHAAPWCQLLLEHGARLCLEPSSSQDGDGQVGSYTTVCIEHASYTSVCIELASCIHRNTYQYVQILHTCTYIYVPLGYRYHRHELKLGDVSNSFLVKQEIQ